MAATTLQSNAGALTDAQARALVVRSLRTVRKYYRTADTRGEAFEREVDRLIKRKTRISSRSLVTLADAFKLYSQAVQQMQLPLADSYEAVSRFS
jgi:hypothetical protein